MWQTGIVGEAVYRGIRQKKQPARRLTESFCPFVLARLLRGGSHHILHLRTLEPSNVP